MKSIFNVFCRGYEWSPILHQACEFQPEAKIQYCKAFEGTTVATILALLSTWKGRTPRTLWPSLSCVSYGIFYLNNFDLEEQERKAKVSKQEGGKMGSFRRLYLFVMRYEVFETVSRCCQSKHLCSPSTKDTNSSPFRTINYGRVGHNFLLLMGTSNENPRLKLAQSRMDGDQVFNSKEFWG